jgi:hypothetical protein
MKQYLGFGESGMDRPMNAPRRRVRSIGALQGCWVVSIKKQQIARLNERKMPPPRVK